METITKIIRAKDKHKTLDIPKELVDKDVKVTFEAINNEEKYSEEETIKQLNELRKRTKDIKIPKDLDIDNMIDEMNISI